jgi:hypothetical protein
MKFEFENEMPLVVIDKNTTAGNVDGNAEIEYSRDGSWIIKGIYIECYRQRSFVERAAVPAVEAWPIVEAPEPFNAMIWNRLSTDWHDRVQDAVNYQLEQDREDAAEARADARRDDRMGL